MPPKLTLTRRIAHEIMRDLRGGDLLDRSFDRRAAELPPRDQAWLRELLYGTQRNRGRLDYLIGQWVRSGLESLQPDVLDVLRLGAQQLLQMGGVPTYAAISQSVELVRAVGAPRAAGLVNGVLRSLDRDRDRLVYPDAERAPVDYLCSWGSHPRWLVERWLDRWGFSETEKLLAENNERPELYIRPLGMSAADAAQRLVDHEIEVSTDALFPRSLKIVSPADPARILALVPAVVQDPAAALVVDFAAIEEGATVLDLCSAPGGKTVGLAERAGYTAAADLSAGRIRRVRQNVKRVELDDRVGLVIADARQPPFRPVDAVLIDAPCTGTGTFRRHPDGRWRIDAAVLESLVVLQREILDAAAALVRPGGVLVYATCSLEPEENEAQVRDFLDRQIDFEPAPVEGAVDSSLLTADGTMQVLPQRHGVDGSFAARLRRRS